MDVLEKRIGGEERKYRVLLIEDIFFGGGGKTGYFAENLTKRNNLSIPEITEEPMINGIIYSNTQEYFSLLKSELERLCSEDVELDITPRVDDALMKIESGKYDLIVTDIGLRSNIESNRSSGSLKNLDGTYKQWKEIIPDVVKNERDMYLERKEEIEREFAEIINNGFNPEEKKNIFQVMNNYEDSKNYIVDSCIRVLKDDSVSPSSPELNGERLGAYIARLTKEKVPTVIHTASGHFEQSIVPLYMHKHGTLDQIAKLMSAPRGVPTNEGIIYTSSKTTPEDFAYVIDHAIKNFVEKK